MNNIETLTIEEAKLYAAYKKHKAKFKILLDNGIFEMEEGKAEVNCHNNQFQSIFVHKMIYKHEKVINS